MYYVIIALIVIAAILLVLAVLIQNPKGGGIASNFSAGNSIMGVKRTNDFIEKLTWGLAIGIIVLTISTNMFKPTGTAGDEIKKSSISDEVNEAPVAPTLPNLPSDNGGGGDLQPPQESGD